MPITQLNIGDIVEFKNNDYHLQAIILKIKKNTWNANFISKITKDLKGNWRSKDINFDGSCFAQMTFLRNEPFSTDFTIIAKNGKKMTGTVKKMGVTP